MTEDEKLLEELNESYYLLAEYQYPLSNMARVKAASRIQKAIDVIKSGSSCAQCKQNYYPRSGNKRMSENCAIFMLKNIQQKCPLDYPDDRDEAIDIAVEALEEKEQKKQTIEIASEKDIYENCLKLMNKIVEGFCDYLEYYDFKPEDDGEFFYSISNFEIIQTLFLNGTRHSGSTSTCRKCQELGLDYNDWVRFGFVFDEDSEF